MVRTAEIEVRTKGFTDILDITDRVREALKTAGLGNGLVTVCVPGSTAGVTTIEYEKGACEDFRKAVERLAPRTAPYDHDAAWGDGNGFSHVRAALLGPSVTLPFSDGKPACGTWQQIVLVDFDNRARTRRVIIQMVGE